MFICFGLNMQSSYILTCIVTDRPGLRNVEQVEVIHSVVTQGLQALMAANHPDDTTIFAKLLMKIPDLRTLNTLHSEKLLGELHTVSAIISALSPPPNTHTQTNLQRTTELIHDGKINNKKMQHSCEVPYSIA